MKLDEMNKVFNIGTLHNIMSSSFVVTGKVIPYSWTNFYFTWTGKHNFEVETSRNGKVDIFSDSFIYIKVRLNFVSITCNRRNIYGITDKPMKLLMKSVETSLVKLWKKGIQN